jgi:zinc protease
VYIITKPTYPEKAFEKEIKNRIQNIEELSENENFVADDILGRYLGQDDFLTQKTFKETIDDLLKCEHSDIVAFHEKYMAPHNMVLAIVGDFDETTIKQQLENSYGRWQSSFQACDIEKIAVNFPELKTPKAKEQRVYLPKERVVLTAGRITVKRNDDDYFSLRLLEHYIEKKLFALREQYGLFYDFSCNLFAGATYEQQGQAKITVGLSLANVDAASKLIKIELHSIAQNGISQEDFQNARNTIINDWAKSNNSNRSIASWFVHIKSHGHTWHHEEERFAKQMSVTRDDVSTVAKKYVHPDAWSFVIVGRIKKTGEQEIV